MITYNDVYEAASCLGALYKHYTNVTFTEERIGIFEEPEIDVQAIQSVIDKVRNDDRQFLLVHEALKVMEAAGIPTPKSYVANNIEEAIHYAEEVIHYPVVMKIVSKDIIHKSDAGGVALNLENREELIDAYEAILASARKYKPDAKNDSRFA